MRTGVIRRRILSSVVLVGLLAVGLSSCIVVPAPGYATQGPGYGASPAAYGPSVYVAPPPVYVWGPSWGYRRWR